MYRDNLLYPGKITHTILFVSGVTINLWTLHHLSGKDKNRITPKSRSKKRKRDEPSAVDAPELPVADPFGETGEFGNLEIPDLLSFPTINPDLDFLDTQNSLYQARVEDITMLEDNLNLASAQNLTFGEEFATSTIDLLQNPNLFSDEVSLETHVQSTRTKVESSSGARLTTDLDSEIVEQPTKRIRTENSCPTEVVLLTVPDADGVKMEQPQHAEPQLCQALEQNTITTCEVSTAVPVELAETAQENPALTECPTGQKIPTVLEIPPVPAVTETHQTVAEPSFLVPSTKAQPENVANAKSVAIEPYTIPPDDVNRAPSPQVPGVRRVRRTAHSKLLIDKELRLTVNQLRWNMEHGEETMVPLSSRLAEPSSRLQTRYLLSRCIPRLLAVPANVETALNTTLCELWCRIRRMAEESNCLEPDNSETRNDLTSSNLQPTEEMETSIEQRRAGQTTISLPRSVSLLGSSDAVMDLTVNQVANITDSVMSHTTPLPDRPAVPSLPAEPGVGPDLSTAVVTITAGADVPPLNLTETVVNQTDVTGLGPLPEEREEQMPNNADPSKDALLSEAVLVDYRNCDDVWRALQSLLSQSKKVDLEQLCPRGSTRQTAALTFATILQLLKKRRIRVAQSEPYGPISITLPD